MHLTHHIPWNHLITHPCLPGQKSDIGQQQNVSLEIQLQAFALRDASKVLLPTSILVFLLLQHQLKLLEIGLKIYKKIICLLIIISSGWATKQKVDLRILTVIWMHNVWVNKQIVNCGTYQKRKCINNLIKNIIMRPSIHIDFIFFIWFV